MRTPAQNSLVRCHVIDDMGEPREWWNEVHDSEATAAGAGVQGSVEKQALADHLEQPGQGSDASRLQQPEDAGNVDAMVVHYLRRLEARMDTVSDSLNARLHADRAKLERDLSQLGDEMQEVRATCLSLESQQVQLQQAVMEAGRQLTEMMTRVVGDCRGEMLERAAGMREAIGTVQRGLVALGEQLQGVAVQRETLSSMFLDLGRELAVSPRAEVAVARVRKAIERAAGASPRPRKK